MHLEAHDLYDLSPIQLECLQMSKIKYLRYDFKTGEYSQHESETGLMPMPPEENPFLPQPQKPFEFNQEQKEFLDSLVAKTPPIRDPLLYFEKNHWGGFDGIVRKGRFKDVEKLWFYFPPVGIDTHSLDEFGNWTMRLRQKSSMSRPYINLFDDQNFGFRIRLPAGHYETLEDVLKMANRTWRIERCDLGYCRTEQVKIVNKYIDRVVEKEKEIVKYWQPAMEHSVQVAEPDLVSFLEKHNAQARARLGDYRIGKPSTENVVQFSEYFDRLKAAEVHENPVDIEQLIEKIG